MIHDPDFRLAPHRDRNRLLANRDRADRRQPRRADGEDFELAVRRVDRVELAPVRRERHRSHRSALEGEKGRRRSRRRREDRTRRGGDKEKADHRLAPSPQTLPDLRSTLHHTSPRGIGLSVSTRDQPTLAEIGARSSRTVRQVEARSAGQAGPKQTDCPPGVCGPGRKA